MRNDVYSDIMSQRDKVLPVSVKKNETFKNSCIIYMTNCEGMTSPTHSFEYSGLLKKTAKFQTVTSSLYLPDFSFLHQSVAKSFLSIFKLCQVCKLCQGWYGFYF